MVQLPLSSKDIDSRVKSGEFYNILTGISPERDYEIERICKIIEMYFESKKKVLFDEKKMNLFNWYHLFKRSIKNAIIQKWWMKLLVMAFS